MKSCIQKLVEAEDVIEKLVSAARWVTTDGYPDPTVDASACLHLDQLKQALEAGESFLADAS